MTQVIDIPHTTRDPFRSIFDEVSQQFEEMEKNMEDMFRRVRSAPGALVNGPYYYGFSMTVGPDGKPVVREFGNFEPSGKNQLANGTREPLVDTVLDAKKGTVRIAVEMPGVTKEDIKVSTTENTATISAERGDKSYRTEVQLPAEVIPDSSKASYNNGILELTLKTKAPAKKGVDVRVR